MWLVIPVLKCQQGAQKCQLKRLEWQPPSLQLQDSGFVRVPQTFSLQSRTLSGSFCVGDLFRTRKALVEITVVQTSHWSTPWHVQFRVTHHSASRWSLKMFQPHPTASLRWCSTSDGQKAAEWAIFTKNTLSRGLSLCHCATIWVIWERGWVCFV